MSSVVGGHLAVSYLLWQYCFKHSRLSFTVLDMCLGVGFMSHGFLCLTCWRSKLYPKCKSKYIKYILLVDIRNMFFIVRQDQVQIAVPLLSSYWPGTKLLKLSSSFLHLKYVSGEFLPPGDKEVRRHRRPFIRMVLSWDILGNGAIILIVSWSHPSAWVVLIATNNGGELQSYQREVGAKQPQRSLNCGVLCHVCHRWIPLTQISAWSIPSAIAFLSSKVERCLSDDFQKHVCLLLGFWCANYFPIPLTDRKLASDMPELQVWGYGELFPE